MSQPILCPKCGWVMAAEVIGNSSRLHIRATCHGCGWGVRWLRVPDLDTPRAYLRERLARVARAYRMVRGLEGVHG